MSDDGITRNDELEAYQAKAANCDRSALHQSRAVLDLLTTQLKKDRHPTPQVNR